MLIKDDNYINIQGWMITRLGLSGNDLLVYAIIYGFSQDGVTNYTGTRAYLAEWCNSSERAISRNIKNLIASGLIEQVYKSSDCRSVRYRVTDTRDKMSGVPVTKCQGASDKMSGAYIDNIADKLEHKLADTIVCSARAREHTRPTEKEVGDIVTELKLDGFNVKKFVSFWNSHDWKDKHGQDVSKNLKDRILYWHETEPMMKNRSGNLAKVTEPCRPGYQRDQYGFEFMVNDYDQNHLDGQAANDLLDQLLSED